MPVLPTCPCHDLWKLARCQFYQHAHAMIYGNWQDASSTKMPIPLLSNAEFLPYSTSVIPPIKIRNKKQFL
ncbi:MAG: hypothetical protein F6K26_30635 [Moorea sp. SIO2I5]|nr:hypothetical protein [Moorena sp. SIO2I5]